MTIRAWVGWGATGIAAASIPTGAEAQLAPSGPKVSLPCSFAASDVVRVYVVENDQTGTIKKGTTIYAEASVSGTFPNDRRPASLRLTKDLSPRQSVEVVASGQTPAGRCQAWFHAGWPDLIVESIAWDVVPTEKRAGDLRVVLRNLNSFVDAGPSKTRVEVLPCQGETATVSLLADTGGVPKGSTRTLHVDVSHAAAHESGRIRVTANADGAVQESSRANNAKTERGGCVAR